MFNPLYLFNKDLLQKLIEKKNRFFIRQAYIRGFDPFDLKQNFSFLISHYNDHNGAENHYRAIEKDRSRFLYDIENPEHLERLRVAASQPTGFKIYSAFLAEKTWTPSERMRMNFRRYIDTQLDWKPKKKETVNIDLFFQNGELYIELKYEQKQLKLPLSDIEKY